MRGCNNDSFYILIFFVPMIDTLLFGNFKNLAAHLVRCNLLHWLCINGLSKLLSSPSFFVKRNLNKSVNEAISGCASVFSMKVDRAHDAV